MEPPFSLRCRALVDEALWEEVCLASGASAGDEAPAQVRYLSSYLRRHPARPSALVVEKPYVDRHYLEEYTGYYSTSLRAPPPATTRLHVFSGDLTEEKLQAELLRAADGAYDEVRLALQAEYLGFIVVRPFADAPIGRTILRIWEDVPSRCFGPPGPPHRVHLAGLELELHGVPFQQQDQAVGACATTAVWTALAKVMRSDGTRAATPLAVTAAATRHHLTGRALPASGGLDLTQMLAAIREFGYSPDVVHARGKPDLFRLLLKCYLRSGIPVVLRVQFNAGDDGHAITAVGFREADDEEGASPLEVRDRGVVLRSRGMSRVYVHDDRLGPYARMTWEPPGEEQQSKLKLFPYASGFDEFVEPAEVWHAIAPLYPKLRLSADDLVKFALQLLPLMKIAVSEAERDQLFVDLRFALGGQYLRELLESGWDPRRAVEVARTTLLSRYVGVIRFSVGETWLADALCDTTDILRSPPAWAPLLALIPASAARVEDFRKYAADNGADALVV